MATVVESDPKAPFSIATTPRCRGGRYSFSWIAPLYPYLILLSVKQGGIKYHFWSLWYDVTWNWTQVSQAIGEQSTHLANEPVFVIYTIDINFISGKGHFKFLCSYLGISRIIWYAVWGISALILSLVFPLKLHSNSNFQTDSNKNS